ncbi:uncharacterized protein RCC_12018 [Ramularia collo-cygni]|uniref:Uncharacterized protein n=1 Tax=Ramularia collo-cygni TaxID=112498 RepID=A0A2D3UZ02_9PEZI|nr:uncharacterized protein RCC_12018 [Ramularia collo-cygni]
MEHRSLSSSCCLRTVQRLIASEWNQVY